MKTSMWVAALFAAGSAIAVAAERKSDATGTPMQVAPESAKAARQLVGALAGAVSGRAATPMRIAPDRDRDDPAVLCACVRHRDQA